MVSIFSHHLGLAGLLLMRSSEGSAQLGSIQDTELAQAPCTCATQCPRLGRHPIHSSTDGPTCKCSALMKPMLVSATWIHRLLCTSCIFTRSLKPPAWAGLGSTACSGGTLCQGSAAWTQR